MSKYDFELDLSENTSTGMILNRIKKGSRVLEFGCATGRMTRYMKEALGCQVYIVEYDQGAFEKAMEFAQDGICDDIQTFSWVERFRGLAFDAIIFADVLEHLTQPELVLQKAATLLNPDGCIHVSVPNVTHNDIILKMFEERFDYTRTGLLDDTHIHFWGLENIKQLGQAAGLSVRSVEGTPCAAGGTEQNVQLGKNKLLENILRQRRAGEIYQFVVTLDRSGCREPVCGISGPDQLSHLYLDTGRDFNAAECIQLMASRSGTDSYFVHYVIENTENLCRVRLDPVEHQSVLMRSASVRQGGVELPLITPNGVQSSDGVYLLDDDPMLIAQVQPGGGCVTVDAEFVIPGAEYLGRLEHTARTKQEKLETQTIEFANERHALITQADNLLGTISVLQGDKAQLEHRNTEQSRKIAAQEQQIAGIEQTCSQLRTDVGAYNMLVNAKEKISIALEQELHLTQEQLHLTREQLHLTREQLHSVQAQLMTTEQQRNEYIQLAAAQAHHISELEKSLNYYQNLWVVKIRVFAGRVLRKIKRCVKKILGRINE